MVAIDKADIMVMVTHSDSLKCDVCSIKHGMTMCDLLSVVTHYYCCQPLLYYVTSGAISVYDNVCCYMAGSAVSTWYV